MSEINAELAAKASKLEQQLEATNRHVASLVSRNTELAAFEKEVREGRDRIAALEAALQQKAAEHEAAARDAADTRAAAASVDAAAAGVAAKYAEVIATLRKLVA